MARGNKYLLIQDGSDGNFTCPLCGAYFTGSQKSIQMRYRLHMKKSHDQNFKCKIDFGDVGCSVVQSPAESMIAKNQHSHCKYQENIFTMDQSK